MEEKANLTAESKRKLAGAIYQIMFEKSINSKFMVTIEKIPFLWFNLTFLSLEKSISPVTQAK